MGSEGFVSSLHLNSVCEGYSEFHAVYEKTNARAFSNEERSDFIQDLKNLALRVSDEDLITEADFEIFKELKFMTMDLEFLASISFLPSRHWKQIRDYGSSIQHLLFWLSDVLSSGRMRQFFSISLIIFDCFLCMCEASTVEYRIHQLDFTDEFLRGFADYLEFSEDSLPFNFFSHFFLSGEP